MEDAGVLRGRYLGAGRAKAGRTALDRRCRDREGPRTSSAPSRGAGWSPQRGGALRRLRPAHRPPRPGPQALRRPGRPASPGCAGPTALSGFPRDGGPGELNVPRHCWHRDVSRTRGSKSTPRVGGGPGRPEGPWSGAHSCSRSQTDRWSRSRQGEGLGVGTRALGAGRLCSIPEHSPLVGETRPGGHGSPPFWICLAVSPWPRLPPSVPCPSGAGCVGRSAQGTP